MAVLKLIGFSGEVPRLAPRLLPDVAAQIAFDTRLTSGNLTPIRRSRLAHTFTGMPPEGYGTIYKHGSEWLGWTGLVHAVPGPVAQDRLYFTGDGKPKMRANGTVYDLAVPLPSAAPTATVGGTATAPELQETRLYVYTFVTEFGEESEPSPVSNEVLWAPGQTVTLSGIEDAPAGRGITKQRIYRSQSSTGGTNLYFIAERDVSAADFVDNLPAEAIQEPLPSLAWNPPPDDLQGLISLPNGMMAAFRDKELCFCEPWYPHAWPEGYVLTVDYPIVGLGAFGTTIVIMTTGNPYVASGTAPENMQLEKLELNLPCINARGIVDLGYAIAYPTHDGLALASSGGVRVATEGVFTREGWQQLNPHAMRACQHDGRYLATYAYADREGREYRGTIILDMTGEQGFVIRSTIDTTAMVYDLPSGSLFYLFENQVYEWDSPLMPNEIQTWRSKPFILPKPGNLGAIMVEAVETLTPDELAALADQVAQIEAYNAAAFAEDSIGGEMNGAAIGVYPVNGDKLKPIPVVARGASVNVYADGELVATIDRVNRMARLPSGFQAQKWEVEVTGDMVVEQVTLATTGAELAGA